MLEFSLDKEGYFTYNLRSIKNNDGVTTIAGATPSNIRI